MELKTLETGKNKLVFELQGVGHTFCNLLVQELWKDEHVKVAAYNVDHPLIGKPKMVVETDGKEDVKKVLADAVKRLKKNSDKFRELAKGAK